MSEEDNFFAAPPADDGDAPIVLGPPADDDGGFDESPFGAAAAAPDNANYGDFVHAPDGDNAPAYLGDVNEAAPQPSADDEANELAAAAALVPESNEPSPMQVWNEQWQATLLERKEVENSTKAAFLQQAESDLAAFLAEREQKREASMTKNREDEQTKLEAIEADLENDNSWQRVCKMVELQHDSTQKSQDVKRMRDVMILMKNDPTKAQTLAA